MSTYISPHVRRETGWGVTEHDEFDAPFQWIGRMATISVQLISTPNILYIYAGSPDFSGTRTISITATGIEQSQQISPGWKAYQFDISPGIQASNFVLEVTISIDKMLDVEEDSRKLGVMIREIHCLDHIVGGVESKAIEEQTNIKRRIDYYSSPQAPGILWLASFSRSGNTWMRFLLTNMLFETVRESTTIAEYIDDIIDPLNGIRESKDRSITVFGSDHAHIIKTHIPFSPSMPLKEKTIGAIYILRNPLDIAVSLRKFHSHKAEELINQFLTYGIDPNRHLQSRVSWLGHVSSWLQVARLSHSIPILLVKYEDLLSDPIATCEKILRWLQIDRPAERIHQAVELSSIDNLKKIELLEITNRTPGIFFTLEKKSEIEAGWRFLADGKSKNYPNYLNESEIQKGMATFGPIMKEFDYI